MKSEWKSKVYMYFTFSLTAVPNKEEILEVYKVCSTVDLFLYSSIINNFSVNIVE